MRWRNYQDMVDAIPAFSNLLRPYGVSAVYGVPRAGLVPAAMVAENLNIPMIASDGTCLKGHRPVLDLNGPIAVIDDSSRSGASLIEAVESTFGRRHKVVTGAVFGCRRAEAAMQEAGLPFVTYEYVRPRRLFQWNWLAQNIVGQSGFDIDGVIVVDPPVSHKVDEEAYLAYIRNLTPLYVPARKVRYLVTGRLEKYRDVTEKTLRALGVQWGELIMKPSNAGNIGRWKASVVGELPIKLFVESSIRQAKKIAATGKSVLCTENMRML